MILLDLVIVGVGRFAQPTRFTFHKGYTVVFGLNETGKSTVGRAVMAVLYPEVYSRAPDFINWQLSGTSRAYVTLKEGTDVYRLTRDFSQKLSNLARYIPDKKIFALATKDEKEISDFLTEKLGLFDEEIYSSVFYSDFLHLPSTALSVSFPGPFLRCRQRRPGPRDRARAMTKTRIPSKSDMKCSSRKSRAVRRSIRSR
jgi:uncharacterized protein YhaN